jgi:hypothetical protein
MDLRFVAQAPADRAALFAVVADLTTYPGWLELVHRVQPADPEPDDDGPAFLVDLRARLGPLARSKRLRMVRVEHRPVEEVRFARREVDGRQHAPWLLSALVRAIEPPTTPATTDPSPAEAPSPPHVSEVQVTLHYGGHLWAAPLELALTSHVERAIPRLQAVVAGATP